MTPAFALLRTSSGHPLHPVGIGTWGYGEYPLFSPGTQSEVEALRQAIKLGQNHIDTAEMYAHGGAESVVGQAIKDTRREDIFIASKLWKNHVASGTVRPAVDAMLKRMDTNYLDLLYIHMPWFDAPWQDTVPQIGALIDEGVVRYFGVSNFNAGRLGEALKLTRHPIAANQLHFSYLHQQEVTPELRQLCVSNEIALFAYMPLEKGELLKHPVIIEAAQRHGITPAQFGLAWILSHQTTPIAKAVRTQHIEQNASAGSIRYNGKL